MSSNGLRRTMNLVKAQTVAVRAARAAGALMRRNLHSKKRAHLTTRHDIKLELDVRTQRLIESSLRRAFPSVAVLGEEGILGDVSAEYRWVVDPIDGTVNFAYGIPHACVAIALQQLPAKASRAAYEDGYETVLGVVYDPFCNELWTALKNSPARLNGRPIHVSRRRHLGDCVVSVGFAKTHDSIQAGLPTFARIVRRVRKIRMMGSAALALCYVAMGRFDAYIESGVSLWDIAAGGFIVERAGGRFQRKALSPTTYAFRMTAANRLLRL